MRNIMKRFIKVFVLVCMVISAGCYPGLQKEAETPQQALSRVRFFYPEFSDDLDTASLAKALQENLGYLKKLSPGFVFEYGSDRYTAEQVIQSQEFLMNLLVNHHDIEELKRQIKNEFFVYKASGRANGKVLFTGYFEPLFEGRLGRDETFKYPIYSKPDDLIKIDLSLFRGEFKGKSIVARIDGKKVLPYFTRQQIALEKALENRELEIAWLKDPVDVAFLHIQGSGCLNLEDNRALRVGYAEKNGHVYRSIGGYLIEKGFLMKEETSMQTIRKFLSKHPEMVDEVLNYNPSYVFFRVLQGSALGSLNVPITTGRSIALDSRLFPPGALAFISSRKPVINEKGEITKWETFTRFVLNQDTGGAIRGAGRADLFWGSGHYAEIAAGHMKHEGDLYILIKKP
jgi:membrane-bound lytic murein transglycosylase A